MLDGAEVGGFEGDCDGVIVGKPLGAIVGGCDGDCVGVAVGLLVGAVVGGCEGVNVGESLGDLVGAFDGEGVGPAVGIYDGSCVVVVWDSTYTIQILETSKINTNLTTKKCMTTFISRVICSVMVFVFNST